MNHNIREIYTKAIVAKGKKLSRNTYTLTLNKVADKVLGCYIMNHKYHASLNHDKPIAEGSYDIHLWLCLNYETYCECHTITYKDEIQVSQKENRKFEQNDEIKANCLDEPKYLSFSLDNNLVYVEVEKEMMLEITGETCIRVEVKDEYETWDDIEDIEINPYFIK